MFGTEWTIKKTSDYFWEEKRMVYNADTFAAIINELSERYDCNIIIAFERRIMWIYNNDYME